MLCVHAIIFLPELYFVFDIIFIVQWLNFLFFTFILCLREIIFSRHSLWGTTVKNDPFLNGHISATIHARIMSYSSLELLFCIKDFVLCEPSPQMNIWRSFYEKHQSYGGSHIVRFWGSTSKINCMGL